MSNKLTSDMYREIYEIIKNFPELNNNIPSNIIKSIKTRASSSNKNVQSEGAISKDALSVCIYLYLKYGNVDEKTKNDFKYLLINNELKNKMDNNLAVNNYEIDRPLTPELENLVLNIRIKAEKEISKYISKDEVGYNNCLIEEMQKMLKEKGIEFKRKVRNF